MLISFFEEFPTKENLEKVKLINFDTKLYLAAPNLKSFLSLKDSLKKNKHIKEFVYWPILPLSEGYWLSPFTTTKGIETVINEFNSCKESLQILWDAELPTKKPTLFITQCPRFFRNRKIIRNFFNNTHHKIITAEYIITKMFAVKFFQSLGISFNKNLYPHKSILMYYSSMLKKHHSLNQVNSWLKKKYAKTKPNNIILALGTIAVGILGNEPILSPENLKKDIMLAGELGFEEIVIFRLGGLDEIYIKSIKEAFN